MSKAEEPDMTEDTWILVGVDNSRVVVTSRPVDEKTMAAVDGTHIENWVRDSNGVDRLVGTPIRWHWAKLPSLPCAYGMDGRTYHGTVDP